MNAHLYRPGLPAVPRRLTWRPIAHGLPVPWFIDDGNDPVDFRVMDGRKVMPAINGKLCWICGQPLGRFAVFVTGPIGFSNRIAGEPPSHIDCATFAVRACPYLLRPGATFRTDHLPEIPNQGQIGGILLDQNPGVVLLVVARQWTFDPGDERRRIMPLLRYEQIHDVQWWREGRPATHAEAKAGIRAATRAAYQQLGFQAFDPLRILGLLDFLPAAPR